MSDSIERVAPGPAFLIGAGFDADAWVDVDELGETVKYPLGSDLAQIAFGRDLDPNGPSIEEWFQEALDTGNGTPLAKMCEALLKADYYVSDGLLKTTSNPYALFVEKFPESDFLTYNYDGLLEILLLHRQRWTPGDGFGVRVQADNSASLRTATRTTSDQLVVHLHGSLYVYPRESDLSAPDDAGVQWITMRKNAEFVFDPDSTVLRFVPFGRPPMDHNYEGTHERIIAPIPKKTKDLAKEFITLSYQKAQSVVQRADRIVCIGYNFNSADRDSYAPILAGAKTRGLPITIVSPSARAITSQIEGEIGLDIESYSGTFAEWVGDGYPGAADVPDCRQGSK